MEPETTLRRPAASRESVNLLNEIVENTEVNRQDRRISKAISERWLYVPATGAIALLIHFGILVGSLVQTLALAVFCLFAIEAIILARHVSRLEAAFPFSLARLAVQQRDLATMAERLTVPHDQRVREDIKQLLGPLTRCMTEFSCAVQLMQRADFYATSTRSESSSPSSWFAHEADRVNQLCIAQLRRCREMLDSFSGLPAFRELVHLHPRAVSSEVPIDVTAALAEIQGQLVAWDANTRQALEVIEQGANWKDSVKDWGDIQAVLNYISSSLDEMRTIRLTQFPEEPHSLRKATGIAVCVSGALQFVAVTICYREHGCAYQPLISSVGLLVQGAILTAAAVLGGGEDGANQGHR